MSLRDDFLEALKSVKRDIFKDSDDTNQNVKGTDSLLEANAAGSSVEPAIEIIPPFKQLLDESRLNNEGDSPVFEQEGENRHSPIPDEVVYEAFKMASVIEEENLHNNENTDDDSEDDDETVSSTPYRSFDTNSFDNVYSSQTTNSNIPDFHVNPNIVDGRKTIDFDSTSFLSDDKTIISKNTVIRGALQTEDSVRLLGQLLGDIDCKSNIVIAGKVRGNTSAANAFVIDAQVDGNVQCEDVINISTDAWVLGNIRAQQAEIDGKVKGNIDIRHTVSIGSTSSIIGNISTDELEIKRGAFVNGQIMMYTPSRDVMDGFDQFDK